MDFGLISRRFDALKQLGLKSSDEVDKALWKWKFKTPCLGDTQIQPAVAMESTRLVCALAMPRLLDVVRSRAVDYRRAGASVDSCASLAARDVVEALRSKMP